MREWDIFEPLRKRGIHAESSVTGYSTIWRYSGIPNESGYWYAVNRLVSGRQEDEINWGQVAYLAALYGDFDPSTPTVQPVRLEVYDMVATQGKHPQRRGKRLAVCDTVEQADRYRQKLIDARHEAADWRYDPGTPDYERLYYAPDPQIYGVLATPHGTEAGVDGQEVEWETHA